MIKITPIKPYKKELFSSAKVRARVLNALKHQAKNAIAYLDSTVQYWNDPPRFTYEIYYKNASPILIAGPDKVFGSPTGAEHWIKVEGGTAAEEVVYTEGFKPKTEPGVLGGNRMGFGIGIHVPGAWRKGIEARGWIDIIQNLMQDDFTYDMNEAIRKGMENK